MSHLILSTLSFVTTTRVGNSTITDNTQQHSTGLGMAMLASVITAITSLVGVILMSPIRKRIGATQANAFASGTLMSVGAMMLVPESVHLYDSESNLEFGWMVLFGFLLSILIELGVTIRKERKFRRCPEDCCQPPAAPELVPSDRFSDFSRVQPLAWGVLLGDSFHNFADGCLIGVAFRICEDSAIGWSVVVGSVLHELAQEISDYFLLVGEGNMNTRQALGCNFLSSLTCVIGTVVTYQTQPSNTTLASILAIGSGVYFYLATVPVWNRILALTSSRQILVHILCFVSGCGVITAIVANHTHCDTDDHDH